MDRHDRPHRQAHPHRLTPTVEGLEGRRLPSFFGAYSTSSQVSYQTSIVRQEYDQFVSELKRLELASQATPAEYLALRGRCPRDLRGGLAREPVAFGRATEGRRGLARLDRAPPHGWLGDASWPEGPRDSSSDLGGLACPRRSSIGPSPTCGPSRSRPAWGPDGFAFFTDDFTTSATRADPSPRARAIISRTRASTTRSTSAASSAAGASRRSTPGRLSTATWPAIRRQAGSPPAGAAVLDRDVRILEGLGAAVPSTTMDSFNATYTAAFARGTPTPTAAALASLRSSLIGILGPAATPHRAATVARLAADAPAFYQAVGSSAAGVETIVADIGALVAAGGGERSTPSRSRSSPVSSAGPAG